MCVLLIVVVIGECWLRLPDAPRSMEFVFDEELGYRYAPSQVAATRVLGMFGLETPRMGIDEYGFRNGRTDWAQPVLLALGSSEVVGPGLRDEEIWTARLARLLSDWSGEKVGVYNAGTGGYGPYHASVVLQRFINRQVKPSVVIVPVSLGDRGFLPPGEDEVEREKNEKRRRDLIRKYTLFLPFLYNKAELQFESIRGILSLRKEGGVFGADGETTAAAEEMWSRNKEYWVKIATVCEQLRIPVLFIIYNPYGTPGGDSLFSIFSAHFGRSPCKLVSMLGPSQFGLRQSDVSDRRNAFREKYTLRYDPHANSLQHEIIAKELARLLTAAKVSLRGGVSCPVPTKRGAA